MALREEGGVGEMDQKKVKEIEELKQLYDDLPEFLAQYNGDNLKWFAYELFLHGSSGAKKKHE